MPNQIRSKWQYWIAGCFLTLPFAVFGKIIVPCMIASGACDFAPTRQYYLNMIVHQQPFLLAGIAILLTLFGIPIARWFWRIIIILIILNGIASFFIISNSLLGMYGPDGSGTRDGMYFILLVNVFLAFILPFFLGINTADEARFVGKAFVSTMILGLIVWLLTSVFVSWTIRQRAAAVAPQGYQLLLPKFWLCDGYVPITNTSLFWLPQYALSFGSPDYGTIIYGPPPYHLILVPAGNVASDNINNFHWSFKQMDFVKGLSGFCRPS